MGVDNSTHVTRFCELLKGRTDSKDPIDVYLINTTGRVGTEFDWVEVKLKDKTIQKPKTRFKKLEVRLSL
jgi:hypothetical protein